MRIIETKYKDQETSYEKQIIEKQQIKKAKICELEKAQNINIK